MGLMHMNRVRWILLCVAGLAVRASSLEVGVASGASKNVQAEPPGATNSPGIHLAREGAGVQLAFDGMLQEANSIAGPWRDVPEAASPWRLGLTNSPAFYRTRSIAPESIFLSRSVVEWSVTAPLQSNFDLAFAGVPDGFIPPKRQKPYFEATLKMGASTLPVTMRVRGNSSLQECPFPKLKFKISKEQRKGTPFYDAREIKIGTHCAEGGSGNVGRLRDERATFREALAYETTELLGFISPRVRRARIDFQDTSPTNASNPGGWSVLREALILDDIEVVAERLGGRALTDVEIAALRDPGFGAQLITDMHFLHILLGNWDFTLPFDGSSLWNTEVIELADGKLIPVPGDFDLSSWVTGKVRNRAPRDYHPDWPPLYRQARYDLELLLQQVSSDVFDAARTRFVQMRSAIESQIADAEIDEEGRSNAFDHVIAFFDALKFENR
jgi:hypothetical protein